MIIRSRARADRLIHRYSRCSTNGLCFLLDPLDTETCLYDAEKLLLQDLIPDINIVNLVLHYLSIYASRRSYITSYIMFSSRYIGWQTIFVTSQWRIAFLDLVYRWRKFYAKYDR
jgi:hypothetical protein